MENLINSNTQNNYIEEDKQTFLKRIKEVIGLSATLLITCSLSIIFVILLIFSSIENIEYLQDLNNFNSVNNFNPNFYDGYVYSKLAAQVAAFAILFAIFIVFSLSLGIASAVCSSRAYRWLSDRHYMGDEGNIIYICSIIAIFLIPLILNSVVLAYACGLERKAKNNQLKMGVIPQMFNTYPYGTNPYYPQNNFGTNNPYNPYNPNNNQGFNNNPYNPNNNQGFNNPNNNQGLNNNPYNPNYPNNMPN